MAKVQPFTAVCSGGLDLVTSDYELLRAPNLAKKLTNFEVATDGGYRRINGYQKHGEGSATRPEGANRILGIQPYGEGVIVCVDTSIYYSEDGISWLQVNKDTGASGSSEAVIVSDAALDRPNQGRAQFVLMDAPTGKTTTDYGVLCIATGADDLGLFRIEGTGGSKIFFYEELGAANPVAAKYLEVHEQHLCVVDSENEPETVYFSANNEEDDFTGTGSGSVTLPHKIVGIKSFRGDLYIFTDRSIHKLININISANIAIVDITKDLGCVSGYTIQEINGDLIFLASDGLRTISATERIGDTEMGLLSTKIRPLINSLVDTSNNYIFASVVIKSKNQYRLFYTDADISAGKQRGIIGTLRPDFNTGQLAFEWSETEGIEVTAIGRDFSNENSFERIYHGDNDGYIYEHDTGSNFDGSNISYSFKTPDFDLGDAGLRKTLHWMHLSIRPEGAVTFSFRSKFDFDSTDIVQPPLQDISVSASGSKYGTAKYGTATYGSTTRYNRVNLRGSGTSVSFHFTGSDMSDPFIIDGFYLTFAPHDRR